MQGSAPTLGQPLDRAPHHKVVSPSVLLRFVRGAELVNRIAVELEKDRGGDAVRSDFRQNHEAVSSRNDLLMNILKESKRLRGQTVTPAGPTMELVEVVNGFGR